MDEQLQRKGIMGSPIPILYVNHSSAVSGAEESMLALISRLDRNEFMPYLACPPGALVTRAAEINVEAFPLPLTRFHRTSNPLTMSTYALSWVVGTNQLRRIVGKVKPKLVHSNSATAQLYAGSAAQKVGAPTIWHARDLRRLPFPAESVCRGADRVIAVSEAVAASLAAAGLSRPKVARIYNGIDAAAWRAKVTGKDIRAELELPGTSRIILMAAQFAPWKRHEDAIRAMPNVLAKEPNARLIIAGEDLFGDHAPLKDSLVALCAELKVKEHVRFVGYRNDLADLMNSAELILVPSDAEPFGRVAIEAMAMSKPVIGTRAGGLPEVVADGETGLLVVPRFPESLAKACLIVLEDAALARSYGEAGLKRVEKHFPIEKMVQETQALYKSTLHPPLKWVR